MPFQADSGEWLVAEANVDITDRKQAEEALRQSEVRHRRLLEQLYEGIWAIDENAVTTFVNERMAEMLGYTKQEMLGRSPADWMDEGARETFKARFAERRRGIREQYDVEFLRKDGTRLIAAVATSPIMDERGNFCGAVAGVIDISDRKQAEERAKASHRRLRSLGAKLAVAEEQERCRIAAGLHDNVVQALVLAKMKLETLAARKSAAQVYLSPAVAGGVVEASLGLTPAKGASGAAALTPRQREVLQLLAEGLNAKRIAARLHVSVKTVETHRAQTMKKLGCQSVAELTKYAIREGLTTVD